MKGKKLFRKDSGEIGYLTLRKNNKTKLTPYSK